MFAQVGVVRYLQWESHLGQNMDMMGDTPVRFQDKSLLVQKMDLS